METQTIQLRFSKKTMPLYAQVKSIIKERIESNEYAPGDMIPSEAKLQEEFNVSRITVRQALKQLEDEGFIERTRGRGTRVVFKNKIVEELIKIRTFTEEMVQRGIKPGTKYGHIELIRATSELSKIFNCDENTQLYCLSRIRTGDDIPLVYTVSYFPLEQNLPLDDEVYQGNLFTLLEEFETDSSIHTEERIQAAIVSKNMAEKLQMEKGAALLVRERIFFDSNNKVIAYVIAHYPGDRYLYKIELNK